MGLLGAARIISPRLTQAEPQCFKRGEGFAMKQKQKRNCRRSAFPPVSRRRQFQFFVLRSALDADPAGLIHVTTDEWVIDVEGLPEAHGAPILFDSPGLIVGPVEGNIPSDSGLTFSFQVWE